MAIENIDLSQEIESWKSAVYGKDVRSANVAAFEKIQGTVNDTVQNVNQAAEDSASASNNAQAAVDSIQTAITTATEKAAEAETSANQAAGSQAAAASSQTAAAQSETNAAASAAEARQIADGFGGFDGTAASVTATDTYGLVVAALGESTTQALIDAIANKVINELVAKSQIINNLLATVPGNALDAVQGKKLMDLYTQLNGELKARIMLRTIPADGATTPAAALKSHWNLFDIKSACLAYLNTTTIHAGAFVFKLSNDYGAAIIIGYDGTTVKPTYLRLNNGNWTETSL